MRALELMKGLRKEIPNVRLVRDLIKRPGLKGPWFHGTDPQSAKAILSEGINPEKFKAWRFGEPLGFSVTPDPLEATGFGSHILRLALDMDPKRIVSAQSPQGSYAAYKLLMDAVKRAGSPSKRTLANLIESEGDSKLTALINENFTRNLMKAGYEGMWLPPPYKSELELRVLNPDAILPMYEMPNLKSIGPVLGRYHDRVIPKIISQMNKETRGPNYLTRLLNELR